MLPFHKRSRMTSAIEIGSEELEAIEVPRVRAPSVRPAAFRKSLQSWGDEEMTVVRLDKRVSTSPPPRAAVVMPRIPQNLAPRFDDSDARGFPRQRYSDDEPTMLHPSSTSQRPLLSMASPHVRSVIVDEEPPPSSRRRLHEVPPPPPSRAMVDDAPRSSVAVDASASSSAHVKAVDLSMTSSLSGSTDVRKLQGGFMRAATLVALGVFGGLIAAFAAHGDSLSTLASLVDPSHVSADVASVHAAAQPQEVQQAPNANAMVPAMMPGAATPRAQAISVKPAAPSCNADAVPAAKAEAKAEPKVERKVVEVVAEPVAPKPVQRYVAPVVRHSEPAPARVAEAAPPAPRPVVARPARHHGGDEMESASAADALAKAQLDAALTR